jgi:multidrug resistance efflux pump
MLKQVAIMALGAAIGGCIATLVTRSAPLATPVEAHVDSTAAEPSNDIVVSAQGRVEGNGEAVPVESSMDGVLQRVLVREGQKVWPSEPIAEVGCEEMDGQIRALEAARESAAQSLIRTMRGMREEERQMAEDEVKAAEAVMARAASERERMRMLAAKEEVPKTSAEDAQRDFATAEARYHAASERRALARAGPLPEEIARAKAEVKTAEERLNAARAQKDKCIIRSPLRGSVIRVYLKAGEAVSTVIPRPIVEIADLSRHQIRVEVDERDIASVHVGQKARVQVEGIDALLPGRVTWTALSMGRKSARSTDPAEKSDRDILETVVSLDQSPPSLALGLRVVVEFLR